jgi:hypothetical protein
LGYWHAGIPCRQKPVRAELNPDKPDTTQAEPDCANPDNTTAPLTTAPASPTKLCPDRGTTGCDNRYTPARKHNVAPTPAASATACNDCPGCTTVPAHGPAATPHAAVCADSDTTLERLPAASTASTPSVNDDPHASPPNPYDNSPAPADPTRLPFRYTPYPVTPTLSDDADHASLNPLALCPLTTTPAGNDGADPSTHPDVDVDTDPTAERFPAASTASTPTVYDLPHDSDANEYANTPAAVEPTRLPSRYTPYPLTATLSDDADQPSLNPLALCPLTTNPDGNDGADPSTHPDVDADTDPRAERFPAASTASTPTMYDLPHASPANEYANTPAAVEPTRLPSKYTP